MSMLEKFPRQDGSTMLEKLAETRLGDKKPDMAELDKPLFANADIGKSSDHDAERLNKLINSLDKDFGCITQGNRSELPPVRDETRQRLEDKNWTQEVLDQIGSEAEAIIYEQANVQCDRINGKDVLCKVNIDYDQIADEETDETNLDRMKSGKAPLDKEGRPIELHHIGQGQDSPLVELTRAEHCGKGNDNILHNKIDESRIDREDFASERKEHWKARAAKLEAEHQA